MIYFHNINERGNALFLILIAVALFAALSYAITQSGRGGGSIDKETTVLTASQITQYAADLRTAVQRMILTGTASTDISLQTNTSAAPCDSAPENCAFASEGGSFTNTDPPSGISGPFDGPYGGLIADGVGYNPGNYANKWGYADIASNQYITDVGTNTNGTGRDALAFLADISLPICQQLNKGLGLDADPIDTGSNWRIDPTAADYTLDVNVIDSYPGQAFACFSDTSGWGGGGNFLVYYHALIEQ